jgi:hypothetical protein
MCDKIHVVFPQPGGPYTNHAGWGIPFPFSSVAILDRIISMHLHGDFALMDFLVSLQ